MAVPDWSATAIDDSPPTSWDRLIDPDARLYTALGIGRIEWHEWLKQTRPRRACVSENSPKRCARIVFARRLAPMQEGQLWEIAFGRDEEPALAVSLPLGAVRLLVSRTLRGQELVPPVSHVGRRTRSM
jgi:hypothetical protein